MKQALYRDYRPRSFSEIVGQEHVTRTLKKALSSGRISHAYLFTGPRGVGKTSAARILAYEVNKFPYSRESVHLDIIEIDAASNRRIDEIRELRDKVHMAPAIGKYKVYIIDEVHMLTREAFNALLKTLEEPPAHTIFILATTEAHKLPQTIISRTQRFEFKPIAGPKAIRRLQSIAEREKIEITPEALQLLADFGSGSFRDSISLLDQLSSAASKITADTVRKSLGMPAEQLIRRLLTGVAAGDYQQLLKDIQSLKMQAVDPAMAARAISNQIREEIVDGQSDISYYHLLKQLIEVPASSQPYDYLEISLLEACGLPDKRPAEKSRHQKSSPAAIAIKKVDKPAARGLDFDISLWPQVISRARERAASVYTALRLARPEYIETTLLLKFEFPLHQKKVNLAKNKIIISDLIESVCGAKVKIDCIVDKTAFARQPAAALTPQKIKTAENNPLLSINNIFGSTEVMEL